MRQQRGPRSAPPPKQRIALPPALSRELKTLGCPICGKGFYPKGSGLNCRREHSFDISATGYLNLAPGQAVPAHYDAASFASRRRFLQAGYYDHLFEAVAPYAQGLCVDIGCGDGWWAARLAGMGRRMIALDNSREAIRLASRGQPQVCWLVADLARLPLRDQRADCLLNLFAPANYAEFERVLKPGGLLVKLAPGPDHLRELRQAAGGLIGDSGHETGRVAKHFDQRFGLQERRLVSQTLPLDAEALENLIAMTPLHFGLDTAVIDRAAIRQVTIEAELLVGRRADQG